MILVDSDIVIAHLHGVEEARSWLVRVRRATGPLAMSMISIPEVAGRMKSSERAEVGRLLGTFRAVVVNERIAWRAAELMRTYRKSHSGIGLGDYLVAASAEVEGCTLATLNVRHFPMFKKLAPPF